MVGLESWTKTAGGNVRTPPDGAPENHLRKSVNDIMRETMAAVRTWYDAPEWLELNRDSVGDEIVPTKINPNELRITGVDLTDLYTPGRRLRITGPSTDIQCTVLSRVHTAGNTDITVTNYSDGLSAIPDDPPIRLYAFIAASVNDSIFVSSLGALGFFVPIGTDAAAIQVSIDAASDTPDGGCVILTEPLYNIEATIVLKDLVKLWGVGGGSTRLVLDDDVDAPMVSIPDNAEDVEIRGILFDGMASQQTTGSAVIINIGDNVNNCRIAENTISNAFLDGVRHAGVTGSSDAIFIEGNYFFDNLRHDIVILDPNSDLNKTVISGNLIEHGNTDTNDTAGIYVAGNVTITGNKIFGMDEGAPKVPRGIWLHGVEAAEPNQDSAIGCTVIGNTIEGSASAGIGIQVGGRYCSIDGNTIDMMGTSAVGIHIKSDPVVALVPIANVISSNTIRKAEIGIHADYATFDGFNSIKGNAISQLGAGGTGILLDGDADNVSGNTISGWDAAQAAINATGDNNFIQGNHMPSTGDQAVLLSGIGNIVTGNFAYLVDDLSADSGTDNEVLGNFPLTFEKSRSERTLDLAMAHNSMVDLANSITFPTAPNGLRKFRFHAQYTILLPTTGDTEVVLLLEFGPGGTGGERASKLVVPSGSYQEHLTIVLDTIITPAAGATFSVRIQGWSSVSSDSTLLGSNGTEINVPGSSPDVQAAAEFSMEVWS